jgi:2-furoyl-CoA dehydrogenase large subunit
MCSARLFEKYAYDSDGAFLTGTFADYLVPTAVETPEPLILHMETLSPFTPLGAKGVGEGNCMSTPVCIANAVADALGAAALDLPLSPAKLAALIHGEEPARPTGAPQAAGKGGRKLHGSGSAHIGAPQQAVWAMLLDPSTLAAVIPGCHAVNQVSPTHFEAEVTLGVGPVKGRYRAEVRLLQLDPPRGVTLAGKTEGALGIGSGAGRVTLTPDGAGGTRLDYAYEAAVGGKVASIGGRLLDGATRVIIDQFFAALARHANRREAPARGLWSRLTRALRSRLIQALRWRRGVRS